MNALDDLLLTAEDETIPAWKANALLREIARRLPIIKPPPPAASKPFNHPFRITAALDPRPSNNAGRLWQIRSAPGCVNDQMATVVYLRNNDPRGWSAPATESDSATSDLPIVDRSLLELTDPPFFSLTAPAVNAAPAATDDFIKMQDSARGTFFRTVEMWQKQVFYASVTLTSEPKQAFSYSLPASIISRLPSRFRLVAGRKPVQPAAEAGAILEIARLYLLRDDDAADCSGDQLLVRQLVFWNVMTVLAEAANPLDGYSPDDPFTAALLAIADDSIDADLEAAATVTFWTV